MIEFLQATLYSIEEDSIILQVNGMGYQVFVPNPIQYSVFLDQPLFVYTHHHMREDWMGLFGFKTKEERNLFRLFLSVSGIGPKVALSMLAQVEPKQVIQAIVREDERTLTKLPGVGKKTAQRIILDLKDKLKEFTFKDTTSDKIEAYATSHMDKGKDADLQEALKALGYHDQEVQRAIYHLTGAIDQGESIDILIKKALQILMKE